MRKTNKNLKIMELNKEFNKIRATLKKIKWWIEREKRMEIKVGSEGDR